MRPDGVERSPISGRLLTLSKSKLLAFEQCRKKLWLQVHRPDEAHVDAATLSRFSAGHRVGELARLTEPEGVLVDTGRDIEAAVSATSRILRLLPAKPIFEAAFIRHDVVIRADILRPVDKSGFDWDLIEVKNTRVPRDWHIRDIATQSWVARAHIQLRSLVIGYPTKRISSRSSVSTSTFAFEDVTTRAMSHEPSRSVLAASARALLRAAEPTLPPGPQCAFPYGCEFRRYCGAPSHT